MTNLSAAGRAPVRIGTVGLGGYAASICRLLISQREQRTPALDFVAVCEPSLDAHAVLANELRAQGVSIYTNLDDMLALPLEAVWLPLPIPLHRPFTERALAAGKAVMCEKPAAGCIQDLDAMRRARDSSGLPVALGFQDIYEPTTVLLKQALLAGEIGSVRAATLTACWPRDSVYYERSAWAGRQKQGGVWVMDSPASNALAHFVNLALFLLGSEREQSALPVAVEAELYRANPIENYDTCGLRITAKGGASLLVLLTHASRTTQPPRITVHGERGTLTYVMEDAAIIQTSAGEHVISLREGGRANMMERFAHFVRGTSDPRCVATLEVGRAHMIAVNGASEASPVRDIAPEFVQHIPAETGGVLRAISGIEDLFQTCAEQQKMPHETGSAGWTSPAGQRDLRGYCYFSGPADAGNE